MVLNGNMLNYLKIMTKSYKYAMIWKLTQTTVIIALAKSNSIAAQVKGHSRHDNQIC